jgi:hypothetical protein
MSERKLMSYAYLLQSASEAAAKTDREMNGLAKRFPVALDCLLKLPYWVQEEPNEAPSVYRSWAHGAYVAAGHSFAALYHLFRVGFYLEALIVHRHLSEVLVQLVYFSTRQDKAGAHFIPPQLQPGQPPPPPASEAGLPKKNSVQFKQMFDDVSLGYYERYYRMASELAHGGIGSGMLRNDHRAQTVTLGCQYDERHGSYVSNHAVAMLYGFLRRFPTVFPTWKETDAEPAYSGALKSMDEILKSQWSEFPKSREWLSSVGKLIAWDAPAGE